MFNLAIIPHFILHYKIINTISSFTSSCSEVFCKKGIPKIPKIHRKTLLPESLFWLKVFWHRCLPVNFVKFLSTPFPIEHLWRLLLLPVETVSSFCFTIFSECNLKPFSCKCKHILFQGLKTILF